MIHPNPAIVSSAAARRLPRWVMWLLCLVYVVPGFLGRDPWKAADAAAFGVMQELVAGTAHWLQPSLLGQPADPQAWLPYWLGTTGMLALPWLPADLAARLPFAALLLLTLVCTWYACYHLARRPGAQPVSFAFGGEASPVDYARALADAGLLALIACLGLAQLSHEATPALTQLAGSAMMLLGGAQLGHTQPRWRGLGFWAAGMLCMLLSGAPWLALALGALTGLTLGFRTSKGIILAITLTLLGAFALIWQLPVPRRAEVWMGLPVWLHLPDWQRFGRLWLWFTWPAWPLVLWSLWRWRQRLTELHIALPLGFVLAGCTSSMLLGGQDRALLVVLPGMACLAVYALPTLSRSMTALIDWFALLFFGVCAAVIWFYWLAMTTGMPPKAADAVQRLAPGFEPTFDAFTFVPALAVTLAWLGLVRWRVRRHKPALWKGLVLSAAGGSMCWMLLMTLWLPLINYGQSYAGMAERLRQQLPPGACVLVQRLDPWQVAGLRYHSGVALTDAALDDGRCDFLLHPAPPQGSPSRAPVAVPWRFVADLPRLREGPRQERVSLYRRAG